MLLKSQLIDNKCHLINEEDISIFHNIISISFILNEKIFLFIESEMHILIIGHTCSKSFYPTVSIIEAIIGTSKCKIVTFG